MACQVIAPSPGGRRVRTTFVVWVGDGKARKVAAEPYKPPEGDGSVMFPFPLVAVAPDASWIAYITGAEERTVAVTSLSHGKS